MPRTRRPSPLAGQGHGLHQPGGLGVRVDSAASIPGYSIPPYYDSLIGKLIVHGRNRTECLMRLRRALGEYVIEGIDTTIPLFSQDHAGSSAAGLCLGAVSDGGFG
jgi:acetyl-CoA carboxylase biotin carboxylase subunit